MMGPVKLDFTPSLPGVGNGMIRTRRPQDGWNAMNHRMVMGIIPFDVSLVKQGFIFQVVTLRSAVFYFAALCAILVLLFFDHRIFRFS